jgi:hypothetical protein
VEHRDIAERVLYSRAHSLLVAIMFRKNGIRYSRRRVFPENIFLLV